ncbi:MAG: REP-associated tyrosine transposase [Dongiaceae bacterium]
MAVGGLCYHVLNRANSRARIFRKDGDYRAFLETTAEACERHEMRLLAYCIMPNHFHFILWPRGDGDLSAFMQWLMTTHVRRYHRAHGTSGHLWQDRFKAFALQDDSHLLTVLRYVERNPLRADLVRRAEAWPWSSLVQRRGDEDWPAIPLAEGPLPRPADWIAHVNAAQSAAELEQVRNCIARGRPFGGERWVARTAPRLGLPAVLRPRGRPPKERSAPVKVNK